MGTNAFALGLNSSTFGYYSMAIGYGAVAVADRNNAVFVGGCK